ncbi:MAG: DUF3368 domain-containing protein [Candidatus Aminicenantes bacterium]|nr:DUF3368 domain-containing protein [Candidatus Aminicenantes bacterium]
MPKVVADTTPLILLSKISKFDILKSVYGEIIISRGVFEEYERGKQKKYYIDISHFDWIKIVDITNRKPLEFIVDLDKGEAESIVLAEEIKAERLIIDEIRGRNFAKSKGLGITGTIGVLLKAKERGFLQEVLPLVFELKEKGMWIDDALIEYVREIEEQAGNT